MRLSNKTLKFVVNVTDTVFTSDMLHILTELKYIYLL